MKIAFDVDGVVLNSIEIIIDYINRETGRNLTMKDLVGWELERLGVDFKILKEAVYFMYAQPRIEPYQGALEALSRIHHASGAPLLFITGRKDPQTARRQLEVLDWNHGVPAIIVTGGDRDKRSYLVDNEVDFFVEDDPQHLQDYLDAGIGVGLMVRPWNNDARARVTRAFDGWNDLRDWFLALKGHGTLKGKR